MLTAPLKYLVLDDDEIDRISIETEAKKFPFLQKLASCEHPLEAAELIARFQPDVIFLDIEMPGMSGIDLIRTGNIAQALPVLITSHPEFALEGYDLDAFDYLLKPLNAERFARCARRLHDFCDMRMKSYDVDQKEETGFIVIKQGHDRYKLAIPEISYLEAMKDYTRIRTDSGQYLVLTTLSGILEKLPPELFIRVHRSYVVNRKKVDAVEKNRIHIRDHVLPLGKLYKNVLKSFFD
jgi:DNA-binding LytR/AlgR family response regulator